MPGSQDASKQDNPKLAVKSHPHAKSPTTMRLIAAFKVVDGLLLLLIAMGALRLLNHNVADQLDLWVDNLRDDPQNHYLLKLLTTVTGMDRHKLQAISAGSFLYSALLLCEGIGLFMNQRWAEYLTIVGTGLFIPLEIYELIEKANFVKFGLLVFNVLIVGYLIWQLRQKVKVEEL